MTYASVPDSAAIDVYASWAVILVRMIYASVGADPWTNTIHPAVAEPEYTPLNLSYIVDSEGKG
jgi:hypothetical protein